MKNIILNTIVILITAIVVTSCGDPAAYDMTVEEFRKKYKESDIEKKLKKRKDQVMTETFPNGLKDMLQMNQEEKNEFQEKLKNEISEVVEEKTGLTMEEVEKMKKNQKLIKKEDKDIDKMTIREVINYEKE